MASRILVLATLGLACVIAAGGGAYLAVRQGQNAGQPIQAAQPLASTQQAPLAAERAATAATPPAAPQAATSATPAPVVEEAARSSRARESQARSARARAERRDTPRAATPTEIREAPAGDPDQQAARAAAATSAAEAGSAAANANPAQSLAAVAPLSEPKREFVEVTVPAESVLGLQIQTAVTSETARVEDSVEAKVTRDVRVDDRIAIPAGSHVLGSVVQVERGGKVRERARFAIRFNTLILPDGTRNALNVEALHREGPSPANKSAAKIGGAAVGGAILGAILGGGKGAAIGSGVGAAGGTAATMAGGREPATLAAGATVSVRLMSPLTLTLER